MGSEPTVWVLWRRRKGDLDQMRVLLERLGWRYDIKRLSFRSPEIPALANLLLKPESDALEPPWPDIVICAEALPSVVARRLKARSGGVIRTVCIGRPAGSARGFDLVITSPQYRIPPAANVVELSMPLSGATSGASQANAASFDDRRPLTAALVGGSSFPEVLDANAATRLAADLVANAAHDNGTLRVITSPRTSPDAVQALRAGIAPPHRLHVFGEGDNLYAPLLAAADRIVVTSDSVSMLADALETGKPVAVYPLPRKLSLQWHVSEWLYHHALEHPKALMAPVRALFDAGVFEATADRQRLVDGLHAAGRVSRFGEPFKAPPPQGPAKDLERALNSLRVLAGVKSG